MFGFCPFGLTVVLQLVSGYLLDHVVLGDFYLLLLVQILYFLAAAVALYVD
ncbi:MAG: hypothetical protein AAFO91_04520 [Bacteroidota bacterium]